MRTETVPAGLVRILSIERASSDCSERNAAKSLPRDGRAFTKVRWISLGGMYGSEPISRILEVLNGLLPKFDRTGGKRATIIKNREGRKNSAMRKCLSRKEFRR